MRLSICPTHSPPGPTVLGATSAVWNSSAADDVL